MSYQSQPVTVSIMGGQIVGLQEAILAIHEALKGVNAGTLDGADLDDAIYAAVDLLPADMRKDVPPRKEIKKPTKPAAPFEELL